jgi:hypothetical protein
VNLAKVREWYPDKFASRIPKWIHGNSQLFTVLRNVVLRNVVMFWIVKNLPKSHLHCRINRHTVLYTMYYTPYLYVFVSTRTVDKTVLALVVLLLWILYLYCERNEGYVFSYQCMVWTLNAMQIKRRFVMRPEKVFLRRCESFLTIELVWKGVLFPAR